MHGGTQSNGIRQTAVKRCGGGTHTIARPFRVDHSSGTVPWRLVLVMMLQPAVRRDWQESTQSVTTHQCRHQAWQQLVMLYSVAARGQAAAESTSPAHICCRGKPGSLFRLKPDHSAGRVPVRPLPLISLRRGGNQRRRSIVHACVAQGRVYLHRPVVSRPTNQTTGQEAYMRESIERTVRSAGSVPTISVKLSLRHSGKGRLRCGRRIVPAPRSSPAVYIHFP